MEKGQFAYYNVEKGSGSSPKLLRSLLGYERGKDISIFPSIYDENYQKSPLFSLIQSSNPNSAIVFVGDKAIFVANTNKPTENLTDEEKKLIYDPKAIFYSKKQYNKDLQTAETFVKVKRTNGNYFLCKASDLLTNEHRKDLDQDDVNKVLTTLHHVMYMKTNNLSPNRDDYGDDVSTNPELDYMDRIFMCGNVPSFHTFNDNNTALITTPEKKDSFSFSMPTWPQFDNSRGKKGDQAGVNAEWERLARANNVATPKTLEEKMKLYQKTIYSTIETQMLIAQTKGINTLSIVVPSAFLSCLPDKEQFAMKQAFMTALSHVASENESMNFVVGGVNSKLNEFCEGLSFKNSNVFSNSNGQGKTFDSSYLDNLYLNKSSKGLGHLSTDGKLLDKIGKTAFNIAPDTTCDIGCYALNGDINTGDERYAISNPLSVGIMGMFNPKNQYLAKLLEEHHKDKDLSFKHEKTRGGKGNYDIFGVGQQAKNNYKLKAPIIQQKQYFNTKINEILKPIIEQQKQGQGIYNLKAKPISPSKPVVATEPKPSNGIYDAKKVPLQQIQQVIRQQQSHLPELKPQLPLIQDAKKIAINKKPPKVEASTRASSNDPYLAILSKDESMDLMAKMEKYDVIITTLENMKKLNKNQCGQCIANLVHNNIIAEDDEHFKYISSAKENEPKRQEILDNYYRLFSHAYGDKNRNDWGHREPKVVTFNEMTKEQKLDRYDKLIAIYSTLISSDNRLHQEHQRWKMLKDRVCGQDGVESTTMLACINTGNKEEMKKQLDRLQNEKELIKKTNYYQH